jgi:PAS domain S-box-containing protein
MPLMLVGINEDGIVTQWNNGAEKITGLTSDKITGLALWETYPIIPVTKEEVARALESGETINLSRSQRGQLHFDIVIYPIQNALETGVVLLIDDVTKHVHSMNQLIQRDKLSSMGELASSMAQDINSPLQHIIQNIEVTAAAVIKSEPLTASSAAWEQFTDTLLKPLSLARSESYRAAAITSNLVDFASSHQQVAKPHDIAQILEHAVELAANIYSRTENLSFQKITIERHYEKDLPKAPCNSSELQQVFLSLLRHCCYALAEKARDPYRQLATMTEPPADMERAANSAHSETDVGEWQPKIVLTVLESYEVLWIKIQHNGLGLTPAEQQMIFEPFFSNILEQNGIGDNGTLESDRRQSFSHFIITDHHKGQMAVTSDVDIGTTFHMELRLR